MYGLAGMCLVVLIGPSLYFFVRGWTGIRRDRQFAAVAQRVPGKVIGNKWRLRLKLGGRPVEAVDYSILEFVTIEGVSTQTVSRAPHQAEPGTEVEVEYDPSDPASARPVGTFHPYKWDVGLGLLGIAVGVFCSVFVLANLL
ncbi:DUF3592 domain-containing protein [Actinomadura sp. NBRC 104412]|uniref:DUF3592 domain-containing protein n=1 Tax=Actinomadura sp. NBRC 104412 TaxID=3032203 RepID=UPI003332DDB1